MHARILERQKLNGFIASKTREIQGLLVHSASEIMRLSIIGEPANDFGQFCRSRLQITLQPRVVGSRAKLVVESTEESCR